MPYVIIFAVIIVLLMLIIKLLIKYWWIFLPLAIVIIVAVVIISVCGYVEEQKKKKLQEEERKRIQELKEQRKRDIEFVKEKSTSYKNLIALNKQYTFFNTIELHFTINCSSYSEYNKFTANNKFKEEFLLNPIPFQEYFNQIKTNKSQYFKYKNEYASLYPGKSNWYSIANDQDKFYQI